MKTVTSVSSSDYRIKNSKFLGYICPATTMSKAENHLKLVKNEHRTATHHCYAYLLNPNEPVEFFSDDGEPGGTAGFPILNTLKSHGLMNIILIVVRYYGGTKLGKSGLIDAYQASANQTINSAKLNTLILITTYRIEYDYSRQSLVDKWKNKFSWIELDSSYLETVKLTVGCPKQKSELFEAAVSSKQHQLTNFKKMSDSFHVQN